MKLYKHGMVFGKFMPMTTGHCRLFEEALRTCDEVTIVVCSLPSEPIDGNLRYKWVKRAYPQANVIHFKEIVPQHPDEDPNFWTKWRDILTGLVSTKVNVLFGGEDYIVTIAEWMKCDYIIVRREEFPISATMVRESPIEFWDYIPRVVRPYFAKKVLVVGGMSTGKSTLTEMLADYYHTNFVEECARTFIDDHGMSYENFRWWAFEHKRTQERMIQFANKVMFVDTDAWTTSMYSDMYYGEVDYHVSQIALHERYDLVLLTTPDIPFEEEKGRDFGNQRWEIHGKFKDHLVKTNVPFVEISGYWNTRFDTATKAVNKLLGCD